jgi:uncharacterized coiled-coil protein SlyX
MEPQWPKFVAKGVNFEDFRQDLDITDLNRRLERTGAALERVALRVRDNATYVDSLRNQVEVHERNVEQAINTLSDHVARVEQQFKEFLGNFDRLQKRLEEAGQAQSSKQESPGDERKPTARKSPRK